MSYFHCSNKEMDSENCTYGTYRRAKQRVKQRKVLQNRVLECEAIISSLGEEVDRMKIQADTRQEEMKKLLVEDAKQKRMIKCLADENIKLRDKLKN